MRLYQEKDCTGCGACAQRCPKAAITMVPDECGFVFPSVDAAACVACGLCVEVCPLHRQGRSPQHRAKAFALRYRAADVLRASASGGAFTAIVQAAAPDVVFGAEMGPDLQVCHVGVRPQHALGRLRGSKYVQSDTGDTFCQAQACLQRGETVLYTGTPCQIAGLKAFLQRDWPNLITCDLVCEGVQSQQFFDRYIRYLQAQRGANVSAVQFRSKAHGWERSCLRISFSDGSCLEEICHTKDTPYMNSMLFQGGCREICYRCPFAALPRQGDFTIGDLWGWRQMTPQWGADQGISLLLCNTPKAMDCLPRLQQAADLLPVSLQAAARENPNLCRPTPMPPQRPQYMQAVAQLPFDALVRRWLRPRSALRKCLSKAKYSLRRTGKAAAGRAGRPEREQR